MKCEKCGNTSDIRLTEIVRGRPRDSRLCTACLDVPSRAEPCQMHLRDDEARKAAAAIRKMLSGGKDPFPTCR